eukprot:288330-Chlamydomonas_euryale.AAC.1
MGCKGYVAEVLSGGQQRQDLGPLGCLVGLSWFARDNPDVAGQRAICMPHRAPTTCVCHTRHPPHAPATHGTCHTQRPHTRMPHMAPITHGTCQLRTFPDLVMKNKNAR